MRAIAATGGWVEDSLVIERSNNVFRREGPPGADMFAGVAGLSKIKASERFLTQLLQAAGRDLVKRDFFLIVGQMRSDDVHADVIKMLDLITATSGYRAGPSTNVAFNRRNWAHRSRPPRCGTDLRRGS